MTSEEAKRRINEFGPNELAKEEKTPLWKMVVAQFQDFLVQILLASAFLSFILAFFEDLEKEGITAFIEPFVILAILIANAIMGVWQENNAQNSLDALKQMQSEHAQCIRDGKLIPELPAAELVPGDIVEIMVGNKAPADCRLLNLSSTSFRTNESSLTGEVKEIDKRPDVVAKENPVISDKFNMVFSGSTIVNGKAICMVVSTGMNTEIGKIQSGVMKAKEEEEKTPLGKKIDEFGNTLAYGIGIICVIVWLMNIPNFSDPLHGGTIRGAIYYLKIAVSLGVAAIPEGLPAVITLCLSLGTSRMAKRNCIVRKLPSVETLGCTTVICSDKTGTLTTNQMTVVRLAHFGDKEGLMLTHIVSGSSYQPEGEIKDLPESFSESSNLNEISKICTLCNDSSVEFEVEKGKFIASGPPTEAALRTMVEKLGCTAGHPKNPPHMCNATRNIWEKEYDKLVTLEFNRNRKSMSVIVRKNNNNELLVKGAPERLIERCKYVKLENGNVVELNEYNKKLIMDTIDGFANDALRTLGFAYKKDMGEWNNYTGKDHQLHKQLQPDNFINIESDLVFCGLVGIKDPARIEVKDSIQLCKSAGIRVIMITGDNQTTANAIAREIGIFTPDEDIKDKSFVGQDFFQKKEDEQLRLLKGSGGRVFSRTEPMDKQKLVSLLKRLGNICAMTGDGVNDAPALQQADIGIAMGISGTEVAKEAADMILADDNFTSIVAAVEEGRSIYQNMKAFIRYLISSNIGEVVSIFMTSLLGLPEGLIPVQLLWVNLVTDGVPATALGFNPSDPHAMEKPPRSQDESLISKWVLFRYCIIGLYVGFATVGIFVYWYLYFNDEDHHTLVSWHQLSNWAECPQWENFTVNMDFGYHKLRNACDYFQTGKEKASTLSLSVLVTIEMFNAMNSISEDQSLFVVPIWKNLYLCAAMTMSFGLHFAILYIPILNTIFEVDPLDIWELFLVLCWSFPVVIIDEVLKWFSRKYNLK